MRHTLLPLEERRVLHREYYIRAAVVLIFMLSVSILIGVISMFPSFIRASSEENIAHSEVASMKVKKDNSELNDLEKNIALSKKLLTYFGDEAFKQKISNVVGGVVNMRENLRFTSIAVSKVSTTTISIIIQGVAPTRNSLISFKNRFESATIGNEVELPVSQLSKSSNIQFSLKLNQRLQ